MHIERVTLQGIGACNEDALIERPEAGIFGVLDGITSIVKWQRADGLTGGAVAAAGVRAFIEGCAADLPLHEMVIKANRRLRETMEEYGVDTGDKPSLWGCAGALVRIGPTWVEHCHAGDCLIYAIYDDDEILELTRDSVDPFERRTLEAFERSGRVRDERLLQQIRANRSYANTAGGYTVINGEPALADFLEFGRISRQGLGALLLITDGMTWPEPLPRAERYGRMVSEILSHGLARYAARLMEMENSDPEMVRYPRLKHADDKTAILIRFG